MPSKADDCRDKLVVKGFTTGSVADRLMAYMRSKGGTGSIADMQSQLRPGKKVSYYFDPNEIP